MTTAVGRSPSGRAAAATQSNPQAVSSKADIPNAGAMVGQFALVRRDNSWDPVSVDVRQIAKTTPKLVKFDGSRFPRQVSMLNLVGVVPTKEEAERLRDAIAGVAGEYQRRRRAAEDERSRRVTEALTAANKQVERLLDEAEHASGMSAFGQDPKGLEAKPASPTGEAGDATGASQ